ncbi:aldo/keto reductase [Marinithermus hydrothermalis]|uniref:2,5-didehydrogluconate reductase n=1 Tax=Marinithermus hydrothermalis (strain DSM 14884 / JCM 11576 / T1) TaxID=869210 RepID=F2NRA5_MARHT|nr:aldo/keto reductase [Marinithermus hydrothermalis]AEB12954.1 2,5-didehydrogluconate reductase [Marinithermus hydrothermalis DSM 14884]
MPALSEHVIGLGTWQWGDRVFWGYGQGYGPEDLKGALEESLKAGVRLVDTAEIYGLGRAERLLGEFLEGRAKPFLVSKFFPYPWRVRRKDLIQALKRSLKRLRVEALDLYLLHWPWPPRSVAFWVEAMVEAYEAGLVRGVGLSNATEAHLEAALAVLSRHGVPLLANQVEYHLLHRTPEVTGLKRLMEQEGIRLMAYSPLAMGWLTGKYTRERPPGGYRNRYRNHPRLDAVLSALKTVAEQRRVAPSQVALAWVIAQGALPIPGAKNPRQAKANAAAANLRLTPEERALLDRASAVEGG